MKNLDYPSDIKLLISGNWVTGSAGKSEKVFDPRIGSPIGTVHHASSGDLDNAIAASQRGFEVWRNTPAFERQSVISRAAALLKERKSRICRVLTLEQGKPLREAEQELGASIAVLEWFGEEAKRIYGRQVPARIPNMRQTVVREPVGPSLAFIAWNFPALNFMRKVGAAIAAGCSIIIKPSEETPATAAEIGQALQDAGLPDGVLGIVFGVPAEVSEHLMASPLMRKVSFTGSVPVGQHLQVLAAKTLKRSTMELGGHGPVLVFEDADIETTAKMSVASKFRNAGQVCVSPTRFIVHEKIYEQFVERFSSHAASLRVGDGLDEKTDMGPLSSERRLQSVENFVQDAVAQGAELVNGGARVGNEGYYYQPTVLGRVPLNSRIMNEEPFGPVASMVSFSDAEEALVEANRLPYGLAAYAFSSSQSLTNLVSDRINAGMLGMNSFNIASPETPFGGVDYSGFGSEGGIEGVEAYLRTKLITETILS